MHHTSVITVGRIGDALSSGVIHVTRLTGMVWSTRHFCFKYAVITTAKCERLGLFPVTWAEWCALSNVGTATVDVSETESDDDEDEEDGDENKQYNKPDFLVEHLLYKEYRSGGRFRGSTNVVYSIGVKDD